MPRQVEKRLKGQKQVTAQETFDFSTPQRRGAASPTDPYVRQAPSSGATNLINFVESLKGASKAVVQATEVYKGEQRVKGRAAAARGEKASENAHWAFLEEHERMSGESAAYEYEQKMTQLLETSWRDDPQTFDEKKDALTKEYINGATDPFIDGFIKRGMPVDNAIEKKYQDRQLKIVQGEFLTKSMNVLKMDLRGADSDTSKRNFVSDLQAKAASYGLGKNQVSEAIVKTIGSEAAMIGHPEDLAFLFEKDNTGVAIVDNPKLADTIHSYVEEAVNTRQSLEKEARLSRERAEKEYALKAGKAILDSLDTNNPQTAQAILEGTGQFMNFDMYRGLKKALNDMRAGSDTFFGRYTDHTTFDILRVKARTGNLSFQELEKYQGALTKSDYRTVFADYIHHMDKETREGSRAGKKSIVEATMDRTRSAGASVVVQKDTLDRLLNPETAPLRRVRYEIYFGDQYNDLVEKRGGRSELTADDMTYAANKAIWLSFQDYPPRNNEKMPPNPDNKTDNKLEKKTKEFDNELDVWLNEK